MYHLSFSKFIETYGTSLYEQSDFIKNIKILVALIGKYNKKILSQQFQESIKHHDTGLYTLLIFLHSHGFCDKKHIALLHQKIQQDDYQFTLTSKIQSPTLQKIDSVLKERFDTYSLSLDDDSKLGITIKGQGYQYKRTIDSDLDLLLQ